MLMKIILNFLDFNIFPIYVIVIYNLDREFFQFTTESSLFFSILFVESQTYSQNQLIF